MLLGIGATFVLTAALLAVFVLRAKDLAISDDLHHHEDLEQMRAIHPRGSADARATGLVRNRYDRVLRR